MDHLPFFFLPLFHFSFLFASRFFVSQAGDKRKISTHRVIIATSRTIGNSRRIPIQIRKEKKKRCGWWWWWEGREEKREWYTKANRPSIDCSRPCVCKQARLTNRGSKLWWRMPNSTGSSSCQPVRNRPHCLFSQTESFEKMTGKDVVKESKEVHVVWLWNESFRVIVEPIMRQDRVKRGLLPLHC